MIFPSTMMNTILGAGAVAIGARTQYLLACARENGRVYIDKATLYYAGLMLMSATLWPVLWDSIVGYDKIAATPALLFSILWVPMVIILDVHTSMGNRALEHRDQSVPSSQPVPLGADLRSTITALISGSFSIGILLFNSRKSHETTRLIMFGLLIMLGIVLPSFHIPADPMAAIIVRIVQLVLSHFAIGLLITGIIFGLLQPPEGAAREGGRGEDVTGRRPFEGGAEAWRVGQGGLMCDGSVHVECGS